MKHLFKILPVFIILSFWGCSGGNGLSSDDINNISAALTTAMNSIDYSGTPTKIDNILFYAQTININEESSCPAGGRITAIGSFLVTVNEDTGDSSISGQTTFHVSDPTNNLNDCNVGNGIILDGTLLLTITGSNGNISGVLDGIIGINERGATGGLKPITDDCRIFLSFNPSRVTGTICDHNVSS